MESLIADFIHFFSSIANFLFQQGHKTMFAINFVILLKFLQFLGHLTTREVPRTFSLL